VRAYDAEDVGQLSMQVPLLNGVDSQHQAPLADLAEWLSQNLQEDLQGDAMVSSPTHPSRWGPLAPAGIVESKSLMQPYADALVACSQLTLCLGLTAGWLKLVGQEMCSKSPSADTVLPETQPAAKVLAMCLTCIVIYAQAQDPKSHTPLD